MTETFDVVIVAGGSGTRLGHALPKAFVPLAGKPLLSWSVEIFRAHPSVAAIIVVIPETMKNETDSLFSGMKNVRSVIGGTERWMSVQNGVAIANSEWILVHDAARPFVTTGVIDSLLEKRISYDCAITATPVIDTIRTFSGDKCEDTVDRSTLIRVGTPQLFRRSLLEKGFSFAAAAENDITDEAMLMQLMGIDVGLAWGNPKNFKVTTPEDLEVAEALLKNK